MTRSPNVLIAANDPPSRIKLYFLHDSRYAETNIKSLSCCKKHCRGCCIRVAFHCRVIFTNARKFYARKYNGGDVWKVTGKNKIYVRSHVKITQQWTSTLRQHLVPLTSHERCNKRVGFGPVHTYQFLFDNGPEMFPSV